MQQPLAHLREAQREQHDGTIEGLELCQIHAARHGWQVLQPTGDQRNPAVDCAEQFSLREVALATPSHLPNTLGAKISF